VVAIADDAGARLDPANLRALCHACHSSRTAQDQGGFGTRGEGGSKLRPHNENKRPPLGHRGVTR
jgi:5-methylcytosine-specific restriction endonuclease McrA